MNNNKNMRKNYFIQKKFQAKFIIQFCSLVILTLVISVGGLFAYLYHKGTVTTAFVNSRLSILTTADYILPIVVSVAVVTVILMSIATAIIVMYLSHRIAGPLYNITKNLKNLGDGDLSFRIKLRTTDEIKRMAEAINEASESIRIKFLQVKAKAENLNSEIDDLRECGKLNKEQSAKLNQLLEKKQELDEAIEKFKV